MGDSVNYTVNLINKVSGPAQKMAQDAAKLGNAMQKVPNAAKESGEGIKQMTDPMASARESMRSFGEGIKAMGNALMSGDAKGAVQGFTDSLAGISQMLDLVVPGLGQAASAIIKVLGGIAAATVGLIQSGAELALEQTALKEKMIAGFTAMSGGSEEAGKKMFAMVDGLSDKLPQSRQQIGEWAQKFTAAGVSADKLSNQITAMASASALGADAASGFQSLTDKILAAEAAHSKLTVSAKQFKQLNALGIAPDVAKKLGLNVQQLAAKLKAGTIDATKFGDAMNSAMIEKGAGPLAAMGGELSTQWGKFKENIGKLFDGVKVEPFLNAMKDLFGIFGQTSASGKAMKSGITDVFNGIFAALTKLVPYVKLFFLYIIKYALQAKIFLTPLIAKVKEFWQQHDGMNKLILALKIGAVIFGVLAISVGVCFAAMIAFAALPYAAGAAIIWLWYKITEFVIGVGKSIGSLATMAWDAATGFVDGLIDGITAGIGRVVAAAKNLAMSAKNAVTGALGIASPSRVMMQLGAHTAGGMAAGIDAGAGKVSAAAGSMAGGAASGAFDASSYKGSGGGGGGGMTIDVGGIHIGGGGGEGGKSDTELTEEAVIALFERVALSQGLA